MKYLVKFYWYCGRMGSLNGLFVCSQDEYEDLIGQEVYFGEVLGKHSEIYGTLEEDHLRIVSDDQDKIDWLVELLGCSISGFNPMEYLREDEEGEDGEV